MITMNHESNNRNNRRMEKCNQKFKEIRRSHKKYQITECDDYSLGKKKDCTCSPQIYGYHLSQTKKKKMVVGVTLSQKALSPQSQWCPLGKW